MSKSKIKKWVNEMCNELDLEKLVKLSPKVKKAIYQTVKEIMTTTVDFEKKWLAEIILDFIYMDVLPLQPDLVINFAKFNHGKQIVPKKDLVLYQNPRELITNIDSTLYILRKYFDLEHIDIPYSVFYDTSYENMGSLIHDMKTKSPAPFTWYFNGILQKSYTMKEDSHVLFKKDGEYINLQGGISDNADLLHYLSNACKDKVNIFVSNVCNWGVYGVASVIMALHALKEGGLLVMKLYPVFTVFNIKLIYMMSKCFETFRLENIGSEVFIVGGGFKKMAERMSLLDQLWVIIDERHIHMTPSLLTTTIPEEIYAIIQFFAHSLYKIK
jgi:hypothetical protein